MSDRLKLITYNQDNSRRFRKSTASIRIYRNGQISLSKETAKLLEIKEGDQLEFHQNEKDETEWYICKSLDNCGFPVRFQEEGRRFRAFVINNSLVSRSIMKSLNINFNSVAFKVSRQPIAHGGKNLFLIITAHPKLGKS